LRSIPNRCGFVKKGALNQCDLTVGGDQAQCPPESGRTTADIRSQSEKHSLPSGDGRGFRQLFRCVLAMQAPCRSARLLLPGAALPQ
jgi:hypothetical protein